MNAVGGRVASIVAMSVAVVFAVYAWMRVSDDRARIAQNRANAAQAEADAASAAENQAVAEAARVAREDESAKRKAQEAIRKAELDGEKAKADAEKAKADAEKAKADAEKAKADAESRKAEADKARHEAETAEANRVAAEADKAAAKAAADAQKSEESKAKIEADAKIRVAEAEAERVRQLAAAEDAKARTLELRRMDLEGLARELAAVKRDLDQREEALKPEKTIKDLLTTSEPAEDDMLSPREPLLPENDMSITRESRELARSRRLEREMLELVAAETKSNVITRLERRYVEAVRADRLADAEFYRSEIKRMYPGWVYTPPAKEKKEQETK
ncbi:MAG: hypothetical protein K6F50_01000 [Kiritimatiellae bacterium]|nr:hypothetical protein [Kiritimatiellia bacterium]